MSIHRILDANFNRLREALRVLEEYFRFVDQNESACVSLKSMRHSLTGLETAIGVNALISDRDTETDCLAAGSRPEEMTRANVADVLRANFKRAQEACRVIEEYSKPAAAENVSRKAKEIRFALYELQKMSAREC